MEIPTRRLTGLMVHHTAVPPLGVRRLAVLHTGVLRSEVLHMGVLRLEVLHMGVLHMGIRPIVRRRIHLPDYLRPAKNARISSASSFGSSIAAKWPPRGITVHR